MENAPPWIFVFVSLDICIFLCICFHWVLVFVFALHRYLYLYLHSLDICICLCICSPEVLYMPGAICHGAVSPLVHMPMVQWYMPAGIARCLDNSICFNPRAVHPLEKKMHVEIKEKMQT